MCQNTYAGMNTEKKDPEFMCRNEYAKNNPMTLFFLIIYMQFLDFLFQKKCFYKVLDGLPFELSLYYILMWGSGFQKVFDGTGHQSVSLKFTFFDLNHIKDLLNLDVLT